LNGYSNFAEMSICGPFNNKKKGWGTDEQAVISILAHRDATQRKQIALEYEHEYSESLIQRLQSELTGDLEVPSDPILLLLSSFLPPSNLLALAIAIHGRRPPRPAESGVPLDARPRREAGCDGARRDGVRPGAVRGGRGDRVRHQLVRGARVRQASLPRPVPPLPGGRRRRSCHGQPSQRTYTRTPACTPLHLHCSVW
jgi:hypothetical protein